jgi:bifunctional DNA-binding transcriptional regulator/antitoxin component of YhaV-PrlF toxin-antitoxin module
MNTYRITSSGQVSIPATVRRRWGTRHVQVEDHGDHVVVRPLPADPVAALKGAWKQYVKMTTDEARALAREEELEVEIRKLRELHGVSAERIRELYGEDS